MADYVLLYTDGSQHRQPIRWRFEVSDPRAAWPARRAFAARPHVMDAPVDFRGPYPRNRWGWQQMSVEASRGRYWVYALPNPHPGRPLPAVRIEATGEAGLAVAALTQLFGQDHPLRHRQLRGFRVTLPTEPAQAARSESPDSDVSAAIDLGVSARKYAVPAFDPDAWLKGGRGRASPTCSRSRCQPRRFGS